MSVKEEIEFLKDRVGRNFFFSISKERAERIIEYLEEGEKYKKIVEETDKAIQPGAVNYIPKHMLRMDQISIMRYVFKKIQGSYFPEPVKKYITIEIEGDDEDILKFTSRLNRVVGQINFGVRTNIRKEE